MLTVFARPFVLLGEQIHEMRAMFIFGEGKPLGTSKNSSRQVATNLTR